MSADPNPFGEFCTAAFGCIAAVIIGLMMLIFNIGGGLALLSVIVGVLQSCSGQHPQPIYTP